MYNYLDDAMGINFLCSSDYKRCNGNKSNCKIKTTICGKCYQDPDKVSEKLYKDIAHIYNTAHPDMFQLKAIKPNSQWYLSYDKNIAHQLSTDYIGPSRAWAIEFLDGSDDDKDLKIGDFLLTSRTIGGHIFWPAHTIQGQKTINQVRGGRGIYDRIDITLAELKNYFETAGQGKAILYQPLYDAFSRYHWFFNAFFNMDFRNYIHTMKLKCFLNGADVVSLTTSDIENGKYVSIKDDQLISCGDFRPIEFKKYISNCTSAITERSKEIEDLLKSKNYENDTY